MNLGTHEFCERPYNRAEAQGEAVLGRSHISHGPPRDMCEQSHNFVDTQCRVALDAQKLGVHHAFMGHHIIAGGAPHFVAGLSR